MARIKDIVETEMQRSDMAACRIIHLYVEGTFCHAYEWSAWLWQRFVREFKVTHRYVKCIEQTIAFVGFPMMSLEKRTPEGAQVVHIAEKHIAMDLLDRGDSLDIEELQREYEEVKSAFWFSPFFVILA